MEHKFIAGWGDMDFNAHMANTAYLNRAADVRMLYFEKCGFPIQTFHDQQFGPVVFRDEVHYFKEIRLLEPFTVNFKVLELDETGRSFGLCNEFRKANGDLSARVNSWGGWLSIKTRKRIEPPQNLLKAMQDLLIPSSQ